MTSTNQQRIKQIQTRLHTAFSPSKLSVIDESNKHIGHAGALTGAGHFRVVIAAPVFNDRSLIQAHRMIYAELRDMMDSDIHALMIDVISL